MSTMSTMSTLTKQPVRTVLTHAPASIMLAAAVGYVAVGGFSGRIGLCGQSEGRYMFPPLRLAQARRIYCSALPVISTI